jgi:N-acetylglucosamine kinase-like BadF-type ATPase
VAESKIKMPFYLGIDAGGTKTESAVSNGAELLGQATSGTSKILRVGEEQARRNLRESVLEACDAAKISPAEIIQVCIGISGASIPGVASWVEGVIHELGPAHVKIIGDHIIAHRAAFGALPGVLVIAGTGSIAFGKNENGETARAGGWGPSVSDEGSAFWIGREAVAAALRLHDQASNNGLYSAIAQFWKAGSVDDVIRVANADANTSFAELSSLVTTLADKGDATAQTIMTRAGQELARLAATVINRLWRPDAVVRVALAGGVLQNSNLIRHAFHDALQSVQRKAAISFAYVRPVLGALAMAAQHGTTK